MQNLAVIFFAIILEALPFIFLGVLLSALIEEFVPASFFARLIPKNKILGAFVGAALGFLIPACDCAVIPLTKRLLKKGVPLNVAITFMLASPIINPVVLLSTSYAFNSILPTMIWLRPLCGLLLALIIGWLVSFKTKPSQIIKNTPDDNNDYCNCLLCTTNKNLLPQPTKAQRGLRILLRAKEEFWSLGKYLILGAFLTSCIQAFLPPSLILRLSESNFSLIQILMLLAFCLSLCSTADSFVAASLVNKFSHPALLAFLLLGPMIDLKNTFVLTSNYQKGFVFRLISLIYLGVLITALVINF